MFEDDDQRDDDTERGDEQMLAALSLMFLAVALGAAWFYFAWTQGLAGPGN